MMYKILFILIVLFLSTDISANTLTLNGCFESGTSSFPARFNTDNGSYAFDYNQIGNDWENYSAIMIDNCGTTKYGFNSFCQIKVEISKSDSDDYDGVITKIYGLSTTQSNDKTGNDEQADIDSNIVVGPKILGFQLGMSKLSALKRLKELSEEYKSPIIVPIPYNNGMTNYDLRNRSIQLVFTGPGQPKYLNNKGDYLTSFFITNVPFNVTQEEMINNKFISELTSKYKLPKLEYYEGPDSGGWGGGDEDYSIDISEGFITLRVIHRPNAPIYQ